MTTTMRLTLVTSLGVLLGTLLGSAGTDLAMVADANTQTVINNTTVSGSAGTTTIGTYKGFAGKEIVLVVNVTGTVSGTTPTLTYTLSDVDPNDGTTVINANTVTTAPTITATASTRTITIVSLTGYVKVTQTLGGTTPSFGGTKVTLIGRTPAALNDTSGRTIIAGGAAAGSTLAGSPVPIAGTDSTLVRQIKTDSTGRLTMVGGAATGSNITGLNPVYSAGIDPITNTVQPFVTTSNGVLCQVPGQFQNTLQSSATVSSSGSVAVNQWYGEEVSLIVLVTGAFTGGATIQYFIDEISSADGTTVVQTATGAVISAVGTFTLTLRNMTQGQYKVRWTVTGTSVAGITSSLIGGVGQTVTVQFANEYSYNVVITTPISSGTTGSTSLLYVFGKAASQKLAKFNRLSASIANGAAGAGLGSVHIGWRYITAENGAPGGTALVACPSARSNPASQFAGTTGSIIAGARGNPTPLASTSDIDGVEMNPTGGLYCRDAFEIGQPFTIRPGVAEGIEVYLSITGTLTSAANAVASLGWSEVA